MNDQRYEKDIKRNKPLMIFPIINTLISLGFIIFITIALIGGQVKWYYYIIFIVILLMFPLASWYNSYFSKKRNVKKIYNFQKETEIVVNCAKKYQGYRAVEINNENKLIWKIEENNDIPNAPTFNPDKSGFKEHNKDKVLISFGNAFMGLEMDLSNKRVGVVCGVMPRSIWYKKKLNIPTSKKGRLIVSFNNYEVNQKTVLQCIKRADTYYDNKSGWLVVGERKVTILDDVIETQDNVYVTIREGEAIAIWIKIDPGLFI